jgi:hypothetical protein
MFDDPAWRAFMGLREPEAPEADTADSPRDESGRFTTPDLPTPPSLNDAFRAAFRDVTAPTPSAVNAAVALVRRGPPDPPPGDPAAFNAAVRRVVRNAQSFGDAMRDRTERRMTINVEARPLPHNPPKE